MNTIKFTSAVSVSPGRVRSNNEDNFYFNGQSLSANNRDNEQTLMESPVGAFHIYGVFDGMGGEAFGEEASLIAAETVKAYHKKKQLDDTLSTDNMVSKVVEDANSKICKKIIETGEKRIGTTLGLLCIEDDKAKVYNVGDSRVYLMRNSELKQISVDDTTAQRLVNLGVITKDKVKTHEDRHKLTQHLGIFKDEILVSAHIAGVISIRKGDKFLICSDGLTDMVDDEKISEILKLNLSAKDLSEKLLHVALENGGHDNITTMIILANSNRKRQLVKSNKAKNLMALCLAVITVFAIVLGIALSNKDTKENGDDNIESVEPIKASNIFWTSTIDEIAVGTENTLLIGREPNNAEGKVVFKSSNPQVITIDEGIGYYKAVSSGRATLSATLNNITIDMKVFVYIPVIDIKGMPDRLSMTVGDKEKLNLSILPEEANAEITYLSNNESVVSVDKSGNVSALRDGSAEITVKARNFSETITVIVKAKSESRNNTTGTGNNNGITGNSSSAGNNSRGTGNNGDNMGNSRGTENNSSGSEGNTSANENTTATTNDNTTDSGVGSTPPDTETTDPLKPR